MPEDIENVTDNDEQSAYKIVENIPDSAIKFKQSHVSWLAQSALWIVALFILDSFIGISAGDPTGGLLIPILALGIALPRYFKSSQTVYYLSSDSFYLKGAGLPFLQKRKIYEINFSTIVSLDVKYGTFGHTLGYGEVRIKFIDERESRLPYIQKCDEFISHMISNNPAIKMVDKTNTANDDAQ